MSTLDEIIARVVRLPADQQQAVWKDARAQTADMRWTPNPGRQTEAYLSTAEVMLYGGQAGGGKLLALDTPIPTPAGWTTMGELRVGDWVLGDDGNPCVVTLKSEVQTERTYRLVFSDGSQIVAGERHQWVTSDLRERARRLCSSEEWRENRRQARPRRGNGRRPDLALRNTIPKPVSPVFESIRTTGEIAATLHKGKRLNHSVRVCAPLSLPEADLLIDPYVLGAWLGDGSTTAGSITGIDEEVFEQVANGGYVVSARPQSITRGILGLQVQLRQLGVLGNKHMPPAYLRASAEQRISLLQGLMDTDGYCDPRGQCEFTTTRRALADGMLELLASLGIKCQISEGVAKLKGRAIGPKYRLKFLTDIPAFRLQRKLLRQKRAGFRGTHSMRYIERCDEIEPVPMQCISVDNASRMYLCGRTMIPTHNTHLELGWGVNEADSGIIFRRQRTETDGLEKEGKKIIGDLASFNGQDLEWTWPNGKTLKLAGMNQPDDWQDHAGRERDYMAFDEGGEFLEMQVASIIGWLRANAGKRCRVIIGSNPPRTADGAWMLKWFAPWLDDKFPEPASPGEIRWAVHVTASDELRVHWVDGPGEFEIDGEPYTAKSYTFIPASLKDNPFRDDPSYKARLQSLPEPLRSQLLYGKFGAGFKDADNQCIPTEWVRAAQARWKDRPPQGIPMCCIGVDCTGGGKDNMVIAPRFDGWFAPLKKIPAKMIPQENAGAHSAGLVLAERHHQAIVVVDMGGGYGGPLYEHLHANDIEVVAYKGAEASMRRSRDGKLKFTNKRSAAYWGLREALDPGQPGGSPISLPPDPRLLAGLTAPTFEVTPQGIKVEPKVKYDAKGKANGGVVSKLGFSPDEADAVVMCWHEGPRMETNALDWIGLNERTGRKRPQVQLSGGRTPLSAKRAR